MPPACAPPPDPRRTNFKLEGPGVMVQYDDKTGRMKRIEIDQNKNGKMDTFSVWDGTRVVLIEIDKDEDGKIERWEHYGENNHLTSVGTSSRDDGVEDTWSYKDADGQVWKVEFDTDRDAIVDKRDTYGPAPSDPEARVLKMVEFGLDRDGNAAERMYYKPDGGFDRMERVRP